MKVGDLVRHPGGDGEPPAIGIIVRRHPEYNWWEVLELCVRRHPEYNWWEVLELCGRYVGCKSEAGSLNGGGWIVISESPLTDDDHRDTLQG
jgi:hypothetical protein